ncbi:MAG: hypothetical protein G3H99_04780 [Ferrovum sp.]|nr:hypothetical protein [Ferrovum sp.]NDU88042.1 hypothetical protein [Ferrovum sp.]
MNLWKASLVVGIAWIGTGAHGAEMNVGDQAYRLLATEGTSVVRVVTSADECPKIEVEGQTRDMTQRVGPRMIPRSDQPTATFPVRVCETRVPQNARVRWQGRELPGLMKAPQKIVVLGDTGCRTKWPGFYQSCNDISQWPLAQVAQSAADEHPDLVIHVGDYAYRESPCRATGCDGSPYGYGWAVWQADFFQPAMPLLNAAPWVVVRGNHESCGRAGQGWFRLLDPAPYQAGHSCSTEAVKESPDEPYRVVLGAGLQLLVMDSTGVSEKKPRPGNQEVQRYERQFDTVAELARHAPHNWLLLHHPVLGYGYLPLVGYEASNPVLTAALALKKYPDWTPPGLEMVLQGHVHTFELTRFEGTEPLSVIAGFGGSMLEPPFPSWIPGHQEVAPGVHVAASYQDQRFGYLVLERQEGDHWQLQEKTVLGKTRRTCSLSLDHSPFSFQCAEEAPATNRSLPEAALHADYLLLGEVHDNAAGHALRQQWLESLAGAGRRVLALEQFDRDHQDSLNQAVSDIEKDLPVSGDSLALKAVAQAGAFNFKGWNWNFYSGDLAWALNQHWPVAATNLSRHFLGGIMKGQEAPPPEPLHWNEQQRATLNTEVREGHCNLLPESQLPLMVAAQRARDRSMAESLVEWHKKTGLPVVLLAGNGHGRKDTAVPVWLHQLDPEARIVSVAVLEPEQIQDNTLKEAYDAVYPVPLQARADPCDILRKRLTGRLRP